MQNIKIFEEFDGYESPVSYNKLEPLEEENVKILCRVFESLKLRDAVKLSNYFSDFASMYSMGDNIPPVIGREAILGYFRDVFSSHQEIEFVLACKPVAFGNVVLVKQITRFKKDGTEHDNLSVNVVYIVNGKINKWIADPQQG